MTRLLTEPGPRDGSPEDGPTVQQHDDERRGTQSFPRTRRRPPAPLPTYRTSSQRPWWWPRARRGASPGRRRWSVAVTQDRAQRVQYRGVFDGGRHGLLVAVGDAAHGSAQDLAGTGLWQTCHHVHPAQRGDRADLVPDKLNKLGRDGGRVGGDARLQDS